MKKKFIAVILAIFAGAFGAHKFYLRQPELGIAYIALFIWLGRFFGFPVSAFLGWYDAYKLLTMDEIEFDRRYNSYYFRDRYGRRLEHSRQRERKRGGRYILLEEENIELKKERSGYLKPHNNIKVAEQLKQAGIKKFKDYDTKGAIEDFTKALEFAPLDKALHFNIACAYSLEEKSYEAFYHLNQAIENGFRDIDKILTQEALAYIRVLPEFEYFRKNQFKLSAQWLDNLKNEKREEPLELKQKLPLTLNRENQ